MKKLLPAAVLLFCCNSISAQQRAFNQNSSRSNHTRAYNQNAARSNTRLMSSGNDWQFGINSGASFGINSKEASLFRGNGLVTGLSGHYYFGPLGLGVNGGFINSQLNTSAINQFIIERKFPQSSTVTTSPSQNAFLLLGPSFRLGTRAQLIASLKGGVFFNESGGLIIGQQGAVRPFYRFDGGTKNVFPGFNGSLSFSYPVGQTSSLLLSADFLRSSSSVQLFDPQQGIDIPVQQNRTVQSVNAGILFIKTFSIKSPRDAASGQATGKRSAETNDTDNSTNRVLKTKTKSNQSNDRIHGDPHTDDGGSIIDPDNKRVVKTKTKSNQSNDRTNNQSCGPVVLKTTKPDGTVEEQTFSCPDDAVAYQTKKEGGMPNRISMNVTTPKQTQGATFGEKVNQGLQSAGSHIVSGKIIRSNGSGGGAGGIVTNRSALGGHGSGAAAASYAATGMVINPGPQTNLYVRESSSGQSTGRRTREAGSGMATGRRQYQPLYFDGQSQGDVCNPCMGVVKNPLYEEKGNGTNPLHKSTSHPVKEECDDKNLLFDVHLIDRNTGSVVAATQTNTCGEYWFANVPDGNYSVEVIGSFLSRRGYDYYQAQTQLQKTDVAGVITVPDETWQHILHNNNGDNEMRAGISTSRSNIRSKSGITVIAGDINGDGAADYYRAVATFSDGSSKTIAEGTISANASTITIPVEENNQQKAGISTSRSKIRNIAIATGDVNGDGLADYTGRATFSDGSAKDVTEYCERKQQPGITQIHIAVGDVDGDGAADLVWSPRSNLGTDARTNNINVNELPTAIINTSRSNIKNMAVAIGDTDGDGINELVIGNGFQNGDIPTQDDDYTNRPGNPVGGLTIKGGKNPGGDSGRILQRGFNGNNPFQNDFPQAIPGSPIGGLSIKGGKNPGGNIQTKRTNSFGEFEFENLEPGNYSLIVEVQYIISDATDIDLFDDGDTNTTQSPLKTTTPKQTQGSTFGEKVNSGMSQPGGTKVQDHNSSRSNKSSSIIAPPSGGDSTNTKAQDHNSSRSNKTASTIAGFNDLLEALRELDLQLQNDQEPQNKAGVSTSRSNIRNLNTIIESIKTDVDNGNLSSANNKMNGMNRQFLLLQDALQKMQGRYTAVSNVLKTKHDTAKNAIGNIR